MAKGTCYSNSPFASRAMLLLFLVVLFPAAWSSAESAGDRISRFRQAYREDTKKSFDILKPCDQPEIIDELAKIYEGTFPLQPAPSKFYADEVLKTAVGKDVLARIHDYVASNRKPEVRKPFITGLQTLADPSSIPVLCREAEKESDETVLIVLVSALSVFADKEAYEALYKLSTGQGSLTVKLQALKGLQVANNQMTTDLLRKVFFSKADGLIRGEAFCSLHERKDPVVEKALLKALSDRDVSVRVAAVHVAASLGRSDLEKDFISMITTSEWEIRSAAIRACGELKLVNAIEPLIKQWKREQGRIGDDIHRALLKITGKSFGADWRYWEAWFKNLDEPPTAAEKEGEYVSYHGIRTKSKNLAFVIDRSGSMSAKVTSRADDYAGEGAVVKDDTRLGFVKAELIRVINGLPPDTIFNVIAFDTVVTPWRKQQTRATRMEKDQAIGWVNGLTPTGGTNIYDALIEGFGRMNPGGNPNTEYAEGGPDTIFLLSDGMPGSGTITNTKDILTAIASLNRIRQVTIHTFGVGKGCEGFLKPLAEQNNGVYKLIAE